MLELGGSDDSLKKGETHWFDVGDALDSELQAWALPISSYKVGNEQELSGQEA